MPSLYSWIVLVMMNCSEEHQRTCLLINLYFGIFKYLVWFQSSKSDTEFLPVYLWFRRSENPEEGKSSRWTETLISRSPFRSDVCQLRLGSSWSDQGAVTFYVRSQWTLGSLSNHDDDSNKNPINLRIWQWKTVFLRALHVHVSSFDILKTFFLNEHFCNCVDDVSTR